MACGLVLAISSGMTVGCAPEGTAAREVLELRPFIYIEPEGRVLPLAPGDAVELWHAPQGGFVLPVGARIRGVESTTIQLRARLLEPDTLAVIAEHVRTALVTSVPDEPGWVENDRRSITQFSHVPACPPVAAVELLGRELMLDVHAIELYADDTEGQVAVPVRLSCPSDDPGIRRACECECRGPEGTPCDEAG